MTSSSEIPAWLRQRLCQDTFTRVVAFGSSNTQRRLPGMHWFDCFELACRQLGGGHHSFINSGHGGDTTAVLLDRLERDCLSLHPHLVFITIGGNDSNPNSGLSTAQFKANLLRLAEALRERDIRLVFQTYYAADMERLDATHGATFLAAMETVRESARETGSLLIDHHRRWEALRRARLDVYRRLMEDPLHVNAAGNLLLGLDIVSRFGLSLAESPLLREAQAHQSLLDELANAPSGTEAAACP